MSISISDIIQVNIAVAPNAVATDGFGPLLFMSSEFAPVSGELPVRSYTSLKEVQTDFPDTEISKAATAWYGQKPTPKTMLVGAVSQTTTSPATAAVLEAKTAAILADVKLITAGKLNMSINGLSVSLTALDFSTAADFDAMVTILQTAFLAKTGSDINKSVTVSQSGGKFKITTSLTGVKATLSLADGDAAVALKLDSASTPTMTQGQPAKNIEIDLNNAINTNKFFYYVGVERNMRGGQQQMAAAKWCQASDKVFGWADDDANILVAGSSNSFKEAMEAQLQNTICVYDASVNGDEYPEVSILARAATVNFNVPNSVLILAFKKGPGITAADLSSGQLAALRSYNGNAFINVAENFLFLDGKMADGTWFDTVQGVSWLTQKVMLNVFNLFYQSTTKIPWTDTGVAIVNQQVTNALELAVTNGLIAPGFDNEGVFYPDGYKVYSTPLELLQSQKGARIWEGTSFIAIGSGALQGAIISGNFVQ
ncbi:MAG: hypothetical protein [Caudoviricetes sp.]|nr:MAG: hypothetical protein [Caudoviricetes sp.]